MNPVYPDHYILWAFIGGAWVDITGYVIGDITGSWGMDGNGPLDRLARTGTMDILINNESLQFIPGYSGAMPGWKKGVPVMLEIAFEGETYIRFKGEIASIKPQPGIYGYLRVPVIVTDWLEYSARHPIVNPGVLTNQRGDAVIRTVLNLMPISPAATDLDSGARIFPTTFDTVTSHTKAYSEFGKVGFSEVGYIYLRKDKLNGETLVFESSLARNGLRPLTPFPLTASESGFLLKEDGGKLLKEDGGRLLLNQAGTFFADNSMSRIEAEYGERLTNYFTIIANPRRLDATPQVLFKLDTPLPIGSSGQEVIIKGSYADPAGGLPVNGQNMITPAITTDYLVNTQADGLGTNISSDLVLVSVPYGTEGFTHRVRNDNASGGFIIKYNTRGTGIYKYNPIESVSKDDDSIAEFGIQTETMNQQYETFPAAGSVFAEATVEGERKPHTVLNKIHFVANRSPQLMMAFLHGDVGDLIRVKETKRGIDGYYYIQGIDKFTIKPGGYITFSWTVKEALSMELGLSQIAMEFGASPAKDAIDFGILPAVYSDTTPETISISAWVYRHSSNPGTVLAFSTNAGGFRFYTTGAGGLNVYSNVFNVNPGQWVTTTFPMTTLNRWYHVVMTYDISSTANDPLFYIDGVLLTTDEVVGYTPAGTKYSKNSLPIVVGNHKSNTEDYTLPHHGKMKDVRVYHRILTGSEVTTIYNGGTPDETIGNDGMVFQTFYVRTKDLSLFENVILKESDKVLDNLYGAVGTPHANPTGRTP
jgi:hypothetical protein